MSLYINFICIDIFTKYLPSSVHTFSFFFLCILMYETKFKYKIEINAMNINENGLETGGRNNLDYCNFMFY